MLRQKLLVLLVAAAAGVGVFAQQPRTVSLVVTNGIVVTVDRDKRVIEHGAVAVDGRDIVAVDTARRIAAGYRGRDTIDAAGGVIMPGLINTHTHAPMVLFRGLADDLALMDWLQKYIFPAEARTVSPEFVRVGTRLAALEMIESGTTTYADMYYFEDEIARATRAAGLRGVLGRRSSAFLCRTRKRRPTVWRSRNGSRRVCERRLITPPSRLTRCTNDTRR
jgi:5-methylthioadenosine/S-adenosylhomocysteine deaminase